MRFATDATLGKLARLLRTAGFDTLWRCSGCPITVFESIEQDRVILTRTVSLKRKYSTRLLIFIHDNNPQSQIQQVFRDMDVKRSDLRPFSRCITCNMAIRQVGRDRIRSRVPEYVWQNHQTFKMCDGCHRIYWAGSHQRRMCQWLSTIIKQKVETTHEC